MNESIAIIIMIICYGLAIYLKLISIQKELSDIKHIELNTTERTLKKGGCEEKRMTKEEAANIISGYEVNGCGYCLQGGDEVEEALKLAVNILGQEE